MSLPLVHEPLLAQIGFNSLVVSARASLASSGGQCARVVEVSRTHCIAHTGDATHTAHVLPALARECDIVVGDWVLIERDSLDQCFVVARLPPFTELSRIEPSGKRQALVNNVDYAFLVMGLDDDFSPRRLDRYVALVKSAGALPIVVLTKADLCEGAAAKLDLLRDRLPSSVERHAVNATNAASVACLAAHLAPGSTGVLLGSSGAGKSTLMNTLTGESHQETGPVRESDGRGRHTTTRRQLRALPGGGCLIDTPGLRGLRLALDESALDAVFEDVAALAAHCKFRDCRHEREPGCAVRASLSADRIENYHKLRREAARDSAGALERQTNRARVKAQHRALRVLYARRRLRED
jgi:ribosome biogenesis GTPase / thiamine phosphate phosphatase